MDVVTYQHCSELDALADAWDHLSEHEPMFVPRFAELRAHLEVSGSRFQMLAAIENSQIVALACFIYQNASKEYWIAEKHLLSLPAKEIRLFGSCVLGRPSEDVIQNFVGFITAKSDFDLIDFGGIVVGSPLYSAIVNYGKGLYVGVGRRHSIRRLIKLPRSFDEYMMSLRATTQKAVTRDCRKFERESPEFRIIHEPKDIESFLRDAETVSRLTYQWNIGTRIRNDDSTRQAFTRMAESDRLRCYIVYIGGRPCAFAWGEFSHRVFYFRMTGYDPQYSKISPGTALLMWIIRDLIDNTDCTVFDFGVGGDDQGYKSRFGTVSLNCAHVQAGRFRRPYSLVLIGLDQVLNSAKNMVDKIIGRGALWRRLKLALRK